MTNTVICCSIFNVANREPLPIPNILCIHELIYVIIRYTFQSKQPRHCITLCLFLQFDEFHDRVKEDLRGRVEVYREREEKEKWSDYQKTLIEYLDNEMKGLMQPFEQQMREFVIHKLKPLQGMANVIYICLHYT